jgi:hypothetical protein
LRVAPGIRSEFIRTTIYLTLLVVMSGTAVAGRSQVPSPGRPEALNRLTACRLLADTAQRLGCYDREVAALDAAEARKEIVVVDRQQIQRTRRSLFGLSLPDLNIFGNDNGDEQAVAELQSTIRSASQSPHGKWTLTLQDGARWAQIDSKELARDPRPGQSIRIKRAAMGSYLANIDGQVAIRVQRER